MQPSLPPASPLAQALLAVEDHRGYPKNVSEDWSGSWVAASGPWTFPPRQNISGPTPLFDPPPVATSPFAFVRRQGRLRFALVTTPTLLDGVDFVHGDVIVADGDVRTNHDVWVPVVGMYVQRLGRLALLGPPSPSAKIDLHLLGEEGSGSGSSGASGTGSNVNAGEEQAVDNGAGEGAASASASLFDDDFDDDKKRRLSSPQPADIRAGDALLKSLGEFRSLQRDDPTWGVRVARMLAATPEEETETSVADPGDFGSHLSMLGSTLRAHASAARRRMAEVGAEGSGVEDADDVVQRETEVPAQALEPGWAPVDGDDALSLPVDRCSLEFSFAVAPARVWGGPSASSTVAPTGDGGDGGGNGGTPAGPLLLIAGGSVHSPDCQFTMNISMTALSVDEETIETKTSHYALIITGVTVLQMALVLQVLRAAMSQSSASRMSLITIGGMAQIDAYLCLLHLLGGVLVDSMFNAFATAAFAKLMLFSVLEMRLLLTIWKARRAQAFSESAAAMRRELGILYARFYCALILGLFLLYYTFSFVTIALFVAYSFWVPQIIHAAHHGLRDPYGVPFIIGMSVSRLVIPVYIYACPDNFVQQYMPFEPAYGTAGALVGWVALQVAVLLGQRKFGPNFFVPPQFRPAKYDYHRRFTAVGLRRRHRAHASAATAGTAAADAAAAAGAPTGVAAPPQPTRLAAAATTVTGWAQRVRGMFSRRQYARVPSTEDGGVDLEMGQRTHARDSDAEDAEGTGGAASGDDDTALPDCVICMCEVDPATSRRRDLMVTPCDHVFHTPCLTQWMDVKMECPTCRAVLPTP